MVLKALQRCPLCPPTTPAALHRPRRLTNHACLPTALSPLPLPQIKRQQQEQLLKLKENPIKMMELLKSLGKVGRRRVAVEVCTDVVRIRVCKGGASRTPWAG